MQHPVQDGAGDDRISKNIPPISIGLIRGENHGASLVTPGDELEEQVGSQAINGDIPDLINDQQLDLGKGLELFLKPPLLMGFSEAGHQGLGSHKEGAKAFPDGLDSQGNREMGLSHARRP